MTPGPKALLVRPFWPLLCAGVVGLPACCGAGDDQLCHRDLNPQACSKICGPGDTEACLIWGHYAPDEPQRQRAFETGCSLREFRCCNRLALSATDPGKKRDFFTRTCDLGRNQGFASACYEQGLLEGSVALREQAFRKGCLAGDDKSCAAWKGVEPDPAKQAEVLDEACKRGVTAVCPPASAATPSAKPPSTGH